MSKITEDARKLGLGPILDFFEHKTPEVVAGGIISPEAAPVLTGALAPVKAAATTLGASISTDVATVKAVAGEAAGGAAGGAVEEAEGVAIADAGNMLGSAATSRRASRCLRPGSRGS